MVYDASPPHLLRIIRSIAVNVKLKLYGGGGVGWCHIPLLVYDTIPPAAPPERHVPWYVSGRGGTCDRPINNLSATDNNSSLIDQQSTSVWSRWTEKTWVNNNKLLNVAAFQITWGLHNIIYIWYSNLKPIHNSPSARWTFRVWVYVFVQAICFVPKLGIHSIPRSIIVTEIITAYIKTSPYSILSLTLSQTIPLEKSRTLLRSGGGCFLL